MSEAQKVTINLGSAGLTYNTKEGDQVVSVKKSELDAKSEEFESVSISLKRLREENAALSERLREAESVIEFYANPEPQIHNSCLSKDEDPEVGTFVHNDHSYIMDKTWIGYFSGKRARAYLSKTPKKGV